MTDLKHESKGLWHFFNETLTKPLPRKSLCNHENEGKKEKPKEAFDMNDISKAQQGKISLKRQT